MNTENTQVVVYVSYQGRAEERFDRQYYVDDHLPLVMKLWEKYGLVSVTAFFPLREQPGTLAICECIFRDEAAVTAVFSSPEVAEVMADVPLFTDIHPVRMRARPL